MLPIFILVILAVLVVVKMANLYSRASVDASVGTTISTWDDVNTRNSPNVLWDKASVILGHYFGGVAADQTTATATAGRLRYYNAGASIAPGECDMLVGESHGAGIGTQSVGWWAPCEFIPHEVTGQIGNTSGYYQFSQIGVEPADNWSVVAATLNGPGIPSGWDWQVGNILRPHGWISSNGAGVSAVTATSLTSTTVLAKYRKLVYWRPSAQQDPLGTTTEEAVGYCALQGGATTIGDIDPCELPIPSIGPYLLGTLVGGGIDGFQPPLPLYVEVAGSNDKTLDVTLNLTTAITAADSFGYSVGVRR